MRQARKEKDQRTLVYIEALALVYFITAVGCTKATPLYCEKDQDCESGWWCDESIYTCKLKSDSSPNEDQGVDIKDADVDREASTNKDQSSTLACTKHSECESKICDLFQVNDPTKPPQCLSTALVCYVGGNIKTCPGDGSSSKPKCTIQGCLDMKATFIVVADGTYSENLTLKADATIYAEGTTGSLVNGTTPPNQDILKVKLIGSGTSPTIDINNHQLNLYGFFITHPSIKIVKIRGDQSARLRTCHINGNAKENCVDVYRDTPISIYPTILIEDSHISSCERGISIYNENLTVKDSLIAYHETYAIYFRHDKHTLLTLYDVSIVSNKGIGILATGAPLNLDRVRVSNNKGTGLDLSNTAGTIANTLITDNAGGGISEADGTIPMNIYNTTIANNGKEVSCTVKDIFYNSIIWDDDNDIHDGPCLFNYSTVKNGGDGIKINTEDPKFNTSAAEPYSLTLSSPCVDMGTISIPNVTIPQKDLAGNKRQVDKYTTKSGIIDQGPFEVQ